MNMESMSAIEVFSSYARVPKDEALRNELEKHLSSLKRQGKIAAWYDRKILPGTEWAHEIDAHLNSAHVILLFISPDFMSSDYCQGIEVQRAMERHEAKEAHVIPVILRPAEWKEAPFSRLSPLPEGGKAITSWKTRDEAYLQIARGITRVVDELRKPAPTENPVLREAVTTVLAPHVSDKQRDAAKYIIEALHELSLRQKKVSELKRVHNILHELELVLELLAESIQYEIQRKEIEKKESLDLGSIKINWRQVPPKIEDLKYFALEKMKFLEEKETSFPANNDKMIGPKWVTEPISLQYDFEATLDEASSEKRVNPSSIDDLTRRFLSNCRGHLRAIDRRLLEAVDRVDQLSEQILRSINHG